LLPSFAGGDDAVATGGPSEGLWVVICLGEKAIFGCLELDDGAEYTAFQSTPGKLGKDPLDFASGVNPAFKQLNCNLK